MENIVRVGFPYLVSVVKLIDLDPFGAGIIRGVQLSKHQIVARRDHQDVVKNTLSNKVSHVSAKL